MACMQYKNTFISIESFHTFIASSIYHEIIAYIHAFLKKILLYMPSSNPLNFKLVTFELAVQNFKILEMWAQLR
jgi:hypothetical protein